MGELEAVETASEADWGAIADTKLASLIALARQRSPFHRDRLAGLDVRTRADLVRVPVLDKDDWLAASPPRSEAALTRKLAGAYVFRTGGSTGDPKFSAFAASEFRAFVRYFRRTYRAAGLLPADRVANLFACGSLYASFVFVNRMLEETGCLNFPFTTSALPSEVARHVEMFGINTLLGFPSWIMQVGEAIAAAGLKVEKIFYAGEHLYPDERAYLQERIGARLIVSAGYAAVDAGMVGYQCGHEAGRGAVHHVLADHCHVELLDPETLQPAETGLIVVTNLDRHLQPVIRYQVGDLGRWVNGDCECGRTAPRFELLQRGDDVLRLGFANLTYAEVQAALAPFAELSSAIQLVKSRHERKDQLTIRVEATGHVPAERITDALATAKPDLGKLLAGDYLHPIRYELLPPGGLPRLPVTGKLKRVIDESR